MQVMSNLQLYLAIGLPVVANVALFGLFQSNIHRLLDGFRSEVNGRFEGLQRTMDARFDSQMQALLRVEQVMDARLRILERHQ